MGVRAGCATTGPLYNTRDYELPAVRVAVASMESRSGPRDR